VRIDAGGGPLDVQHDGFGVCRAGQQHGKGRGAGELSH